jgi:hypothetical protein
MTMYGNGNETITNGHNKGNLKGRKKRDGKIDQVRERNTILRRNIKKKLKKNQTFNEVG